MVARRRFAFAFVAAVAAGSALFACGDDAATPSATPDGDAATADARRQDRAAPPVGDDEDRLPDTDVDASAAEDTGAGDAEAGASFPSCAGIPATCGAAGNDDCCRSATVPGGTFRRTNDVAAPATVSTFGLDIYEVTVARFRTFVTAGAGTQAMPPANGSGAHPKVAGSGWKAAYVASLPATKAALVAALGCAGGTYTETAGGNERRPVQCVNWYEAFAFCAWDGGRLPTEAELNYAEAGGAEQRVYPWSSPPASTTIDATYATYDTTASKNVGAHSPKGDGRWGHADLSGNVWEWGLDGYVNPFGTPCDDCILGDGAPFKTRRSGAFDSPDSHLRVYWRQANGPPNHMANGGLRCARGDS